MSDRNDVSGRLKKMLSDFTLSAFFDVYSLSTKGALNACVTGNNSDRVNENYVNMWIDVNWWNMCHMLALN